MKKSINNLIKDTIFYGVNYFYKMVYSIFLLFPINEKRIFVNVYDGRGIGDHPKYIVNELLKMNSDLEIYWFAEREETEWRQINFVKPWSIGALKAMCTSKIWISTVRMPYYTKKRKNQYYIQTWHGSIPLKKIEADCEEVLSPRYVNTAKKDSKKIDVFFSNSDFRTKNYKTAFWYDGEVKLLGSARSDVFFDDEFRNNARKKMGIKDSNLFVYAPTFRKGNTINNIELDFNKVKKALELKFGGKWIIALRLHPILAKKKFELNIPNEVLDLSSIKDSQEVLAAADIIVSDYSGLIFDFMATKRPLFLFANDIKEYNEDRGMYFNIYDLPFSLAEDNDELIRNITNFNSDKYKNNIELFTKKLGIIDDGKSSYRSAAYISDILSK